MSGWIGHVRAINLLIWEPYARNAKGNLVIVVVLGRFIYFWRKMKAFRPLEGRHCDEINFEWIH